MNLTLPKKVHFFQSEKMKTGLHDTYIIAIHRAASKQRTEAGGDSGADNSGVLFMEMK